jgi:hypothetical protein
VPCFCLGGLELGVSSCSNYDFALSLRVLQGFVGGLPGCVATAVADDLQAILRLGVNYGAIADRIEYDVVLRNEGLEIPILMTSSGWSKGDSHPGASCHPTGAPPARHNNFWVMSALGH